MSWKRMNPEKRLMPLISVVPESSESGIWLDIGTGDGLFSNLLQSLRPNSIIVRSDITNTANYGELGFKGYIEKLGIKPKSLSGLICSQVLHYMKPNVQFSIIDTLNRYLIESGLVVIIEYKTNKSFPWIPYPVEKSALLNYIQHSTIWRTVKSIEIKDGYRPKFSVLMQQL